MMNRLAANELDLIFRKARSHKGWQNKTLPDGIEQNLYYLLKWGPTSMNCNPGRFIFIKSAEAKKKLAHGMSDSNQAKVLAAPLSIIVGYQEKFYQRMDELFPHVPNVEQMFEKDKQLSYETAFRNSSLQVAYLIIAARALGLDCCPMSGFDASKVNDNFFVGQNIKSNVVISIGYGDKDALPQQGKRLTFDDACQIL